MTCASIRSARWLVRETHSWSWSSSGFIYYIVGYICSEVPNKSTASPLIVTESLQHPSERVHSSRIWRQSVRPKFLGRQSTLHRVSNQKTSVIRTNIFWPTSTSLRPEFCWSCVLSFKIFLAKNSALKTTKVERLFHKRFKYRKFYKTQLKISWKKVETKFEKNHSTSSSN